MLGFSILPNFEPKSLMVKNDIRNESEKKKDLKFAIVSWVLALIPLTLFLVIIFTSSNYVLKNGEEKYVIDVVNDDEALYALLVVIAIDSEKASRTTTISVGS